MWWLRVARVCSEKKNEDADTGAGPLLTMLQMAFIAVSSLPTVLQKSTSSGLPVLRERTIPFKHYLALTALFCAMATANNLAFNFNISQPTHLVFRSSSLVVSMLIGWAAFKKTYTLRQALAVVLITTGVLISTLAEATVGDTAKRAAEEAARGTCGCDGCADAAAPRPGADAGDAPLDDSAGGEGYFFVWLLGVALLFVTLLMAALLSQYQDWLYNTFGKDWREMFFYTHALSLPFFLPAAPGLAEHAALWSASRPTSTVLSEMIGVEAAAVEAVLPFAHMLPSMWFWLCCNAVTQLVCVKAVYALGGTAGALTMVMTLTVRKFMSLILSVGYFGNTFTATHWCGTLCVFSGVVVYNLSKGKDSKPKDGSDRRGAGPQGGNGKQKTS